jgi:transposase-like protein
MGTIASTIGNPEVTHPVDDVETVARPRRRQFTAEQKARILDEWETLDPTGRNALLRREGLYRSSVYEWRRKRGEGGVAALDRKPRHRNRTSAEADLIAENTRLRAELERMTQIVRVQGELSALLSTLSDGGATPKRDGSSTNSGWTR